MEQTAVINDSFEPSGVPELGSTRSKIENSGQKLIMLERDGLQRHVPLSDEERRRSWWQLLA